MSNTGVIAPASSGTVDPFTSETSHSAPLICYRSSAKYADAETGLLFYGYRYYQPGSGRWLGRDAINESGGLNLFGFVSADPISLVDLLGLQITGTNKIVVYNKTYPPTQVTTYRSTSRGCWKVSGHLAINGSSTDSSVQVYPTGQSDQPEDSQVEQIGSDPGSMPVTIIRPLWAERDAAVDWYAEFFRYVGHFTWTIKDQFNNPLPSGVHVSERVEILRFRGITNTGVITASADTDSRGQIKDKYGATVVGPVATSFYIGDQTLIIGNFSATVVFRWAPDSISGSRWARFN